MYEVTGKSGEIVYDNRLENCFSILERRYAELRTNIEKKAFVKDNYKTKCFLTRDEKMHFIGYITVQLLRTPHFLNSALDVAKKIDCDGKTDRQLMNLVRLTCLLFLCSNQENVEQDKSSGVIRDSQMRVLMLLWDLCLVCRL